MATARKRMVERLRAVGLRAPGGRGRKPEKVLSKVEQAKQALVEVADALEAALPSDVLLRPIESLSPAEALGRGALSGTHQLIRIIEQQIDVNAKPGDAGFMEHLRQQRLVGDMAAVAFKQFMRAAEGEFKARRDDAVIELLERLAIERAKDG